MILSEETMLARKARSSFFPLDRGFLRHHTDQPVLFEASACLTYLLNWLCNWYEPSV